MTLDNLQVGASAQVIMVDSGPHGDRLMEMGLVPGTKLRVIRRALWRGPLQVWVRNATICLDAHLASSVSVTLDLNDA